MRNTPPILQNERRVFKKEFIYVTRHLIAAKIYEAFSCSDVGAVTAN